MPELDADWLLPAEEPVEAAGATVTIAPFVVHGLEPGVVVAALGVVKDDEPPRYVLGPRRVAHHDLDLSLLGVIVEVDGEQVGTACAAAAPSAQRATGAVRFQGPILSPAAVPPGSHLLATFAHLGSIVVRVV